MHRHGRNQLWYTHTNIFNSLNQICGVLSCSVIINNITPPPLLLAVGKTMLCQNTFSIRSLDFRLVPFF